MFHFLSSVAKRLREIVAVVGGNYDLPVAEKSGIGHKLGAVSARYMPHPIQFYLI